MTTIEAFSEMSAVRRAVWFSAVLFAATPLAYTQVTWTPIYVGGYSEYNCYSLLLVQSDDSETERRLDHHRGANFWKTTQIKDFRFLSVLRFYDNVMDIALDIAEP
ncbi:hypothetical protein ALC56_06756 [Trachymyrmex septentrionalis]|uniref:Uncharacterized protein n=1 Tax=Trachymyrmex septentrionalis TaxID=34720 RepID=A0A195FEV8_9HYME|nr:hypothetical protein ALC56_06756 [Trachymyrmex septentrionalis]